MKRFLYDRKRRNELAKYENKPELKSLRAAKFNMILTREDEEAEKKYYEEDYPRLDKLYNISKYPDEISFCLIAPGINNNQNNRIEYHLNSIFSQNYTNYLLVLIDDASTDGSQEIYRRYLDFHKIPK